MNRVLLLVNKLYPVILSLLVLPGLLPLLNPDLFSMHDFTHVARLAELDRGLRAGHVPALWSDNFGWGYGMPLLHFYAPLFYYISQAFYFFGLPAVVCIKLSIAIAVLIGFWAAFKLGQEFFGKWGGLILAVAFTYAPYRAVQLYVRGALTELLATSAIPLLLWFLYRLIKYGYENGKLLKQILLVALSFCLILLSHNVITILVIPLAGLWSLAWVVYFSWKYRAIKPRTILYLLLACLLSGLLSAWFVFPAFFEKDYTIVNSISGGYSYYKLHFVYLRQFFDTSFRYGGSILGPGDDISFQLGLSHALLLIMSALVWVFLLFRRRKGTIRQVFAYGICGMSLSVALFMMTFHSTLIWEKIPILHMAQFPWRFLSLSSLLMAIMISFLSFVVQAISKPLLKTVFGIFLITILIVPNIRFFKPDQYIKAEALYYTDPARIKEHMSGILKDYLPKQAKEQPPLNLPLITLNGQGYVPVDLEINNGIRRFHIDSPNGGRIVLATYDFIGWVVKVDTHTVPHSFDSEYGFIEFVVSPGPHVVEVVLEKTNLQKVSELVSLNTWVGLGICVAYLVLKQKK